MRALMRSLVLGAVLALSPLAVLPASAGPAGDILAEALYSGARAEGFARLAPLAAEGDAEALFGEGLIGLVDGVERFLSAMHRHGLSAPDLGEVLFLIGLPGPGASAPPHAVEPLTYEGLRAILERLVGDLDLAHDRFLAAAEAGDYLVPLDVLGVHLDPDSDPQTPGATLGALLAVNFGLSAADLAGVSKAESKAGGGAGGFVVGFDRADAYWLAGYTQIIAAQADFLLAHEFSRLFQASFHRIFPYAGLPMQSYGQGGTLFMDARSDSAIADVIAMIHTLDMPVNDPARLAHVRERLKNVIGLSRRNWQAILAETDDMRELVPSPDQTSLFPGLAVDDDVVAAWGITLDAVERVLDGALLLPHWRFRQGFDLRAYFEGATRTDLVMLFTGLDALPFLADGPIATEADFSVPLGVFGEDFPFFALWFN